MEEASKNRLHSSENGEALGPSPNYLQEPYGVKQEIEEIEHPSIDKNYIQNSELVSSIKLEPEEHSSFEISKLLSDELMDTKDALDIGDISFSENQIKSENILVKEEAKDGLLELSNRENKCIKEDVDGESESNCGEDGFSNSKARMKLNKPSDGNEQKKHLCPFCDTSSNCLVELKVHVNAVHRERKTYKCERCDYTANRATHLKTHVRAIHDKLRDFKCHFCDYRSCSAGNLKKHIIGVHHKRKNYKCELCDYTACQFVNLKQHISRVHNEIKEYKCEDCDYVTTSTVALKRHINSNHHKVGKHDCEHCV